ncbi:hypothetical protein ACQJBY_045526 [Aegilops geniculata]
MAPSPWPSAAQKEAQPLTRLPFPTSVACTLQPVRMNSFNHGFSLYGSSVSPRLHRPEPPLMFMACSPWLMTRIVLFSRTMSTTSNALTMPSPSRSLGILLLPPLSVTTSPELVAPFATAPPAAASSAMTLLPHPVLPDAAGSSSAAIPSIHSLHNIGSLITFKLDVQSGSYSKWRELWRCVLTMYAIQHHVTHYSNPDLQSPAWRHTDLTLVLLLYSTITDSLYEVIRGEANTAFVVWDKLLEFFLANQPAQAVHLSAEFRALTQGDLRMAEYCACLKALADALVDVEEPVTDRTLTLQLLRGLSRWYQVIATVLPMQNPFPSFNQARSRLLLEEIQLDARDRSDCSTALAIGLGGGGSSSGAGSSSGDRGDRGKAPADAGTPARGGSSVAGVARGAVAAAARGTTAPPADKQAGAASLIWLRGARPPGWGTLPHGARPFHPRGVSRGFHQMPRACSGRVLAILRMPTPWPIPAPRPPPTTHLRRRRGIRPACSPP